MKVAQVFLRADRPQNLEVLRDYAEFWKIPYSTNQVPKEGGIVLQSGTGPLAPDPSYPLILCPSNSDEARDVASRHGLKVSSRNVFLNLPVARGTSTSLTTEMYEFLGSRLEPILSSKGTTVLSRISGTSTHILSVDITSGYSRWLNHRLDDPPSTKFKLATRLPFSYNTVPRAIRNRLFKLALDPDDITEARLGPVEFLRTIFLASLSAVSEDPIPRVWFWRPGRSHALAVTHDVETREGLLHGAKRLSEVEGKLGVHSTWNVPSARYSVSHGDLEIILKNGELGGHDTTHDGRLALLTSEDATRRLRTCKNDLEQKARVKVRGFRSPLLQHSKTLLTATAKAGFEFDSSVPSWEPLSPTSFRDHGAGTVFPFTVDGCLEIPVSLPQDHQLVRVMGLTPAQAVERLCEISLWIQGLGGACVLLVHPDYEFASSGIAEYERLLRSLLQPGCDAMTLGELADWWEFRRSARIDVEDGQAKLMAEGNLGSKDDLELQLVRGYGEDGFKVETLN